MSPARFRCAILLSAEGMAQSRAVVGRGGRAFCANSDSVRKARWPRVRVPVRRPRALGRATRAMPCSRDASHEYFSATSSAESRASAHQRQPYREIEQSRRRRRVPSLNMRTCHDPLLCFDPEASNAQHWAEFRELSGGICVVHSIAPETPLLLPCASDATRRQC